MICRDVSKYRESRSRTSSESRVSESVVKPTRSANSTETSRRSATGPGAASATGRATTELGLVELGTRGVPHSPQNFTFGGLGVPQLEQASANEAPHSPQNLRPSSFSVPHAEQRIDPSLPAAGRGYSDGAERSPARVSSLPSDRKASDADRGPREVRARTPGHADPRSPQPPPPPRPPPAPRPRHPPRPGGGGGRARPR